MRGAGPGLQQREQRGVEARRCVLREQPGWRQPRRQRQVRQVGDEEFIGAEGKAAN